MVAVRTERIPPSPRIAVDHVGHGPLVVFLHGIGGNRTFWTDQLQALAPHFQAVAWDARGYGSSEDYEGPLAFADFSADLLRVLDHFGSRRAHVVGLSMGGMIAMDFHARHPERVATLTICDSTPGFGDVPPDQRREFIRSRQEPLLRGQEPKDIAPAVARSLAGPSASETAYRRLVAGMEALHKDSYLKTIEAASSVGNFRLEEIRVPTHVLVGDEDRLTPPDVSRRMCERIPGASLTVLPGAGHISNLEQPAAFNAAVLSFLLAHRDAARAG